MKVLAWLVDSENRQLAQNLQPALEHMPPEYLSVNCRTSLDV